MDIQVNYAKEPLQCFILHSSCSKKDFVRLSLTDVLTAYDGEWSAEDEKGPEVTTKEVPTRDPTGSAKMETDCLRFFLGL